MGSRKQAVFLWQKARGLLENSIWFQQLDLIHLRAQEGIEITVLAFDLGGGPVPGWK